MTTATALVGWAILGYLVGSISFAWVLGWLHGMDLRRYGSHKLSGSNVYQFHGVGAMVTVGILDVAKAALPAWAALVYGPGKWGAVAAGLGATVGHNWSAYLGLKGGRGVSTGLGMLLVIFWPGALWLLAWLALGRTWPSRAALIGYLGILLLPAFAILLAWSTPAIWASGGFAAVTTAKRLEGNREPLPAGETWGTVLWRRLWLDRDVVDFSRWAERQPTGPGEASYENVDGIRTEIN
ncbi:MAG: glycerol-3-phosphate acyltransferase [Anaerolineae bacterium]|nr:glycerol-3-phosphate acyltransferase [Anaerolineae bacterium]